MPIVSVSIMGGLGNHMFQLATALAYSKKNGGTLFIATVTGVYAGTSRSLKGKSRWQTIGTDLPHCKVYSLLYNESQNVLTLGLFGRGVWQYYF